MRRKMWPNLPSAEHGDARGERGKRGRPSRRFALTVAIGTGLVLAGASGVVALGNGGGARSVAVGAAVEQSIDVTHLPPLLTTDAERPTSLRYDVSCALPEANPEAGCDVDGTLYVRSGQSGAFRGVPLQLDPQAAVNRYIAVLPADVSSSRAGFSYYAVVRDRRTGSTVTLPPAGAAAPQRSLVMPHPVAVDLGAHRFGAVVKASARVASAHWGSAATEVGIEEGPQLDPIGASSFDADAAGTVTVLDEARHRLLRFLRGHPASPHAVPVDVRGTIADLAVRSDGGSYVLETVAEPGETPVLRSFDAAGRATAAWHAADRTVNALRLGPDGPQALEYPAAQWMPFAAGVVGMSRAAQAEAGRPGRAVAGGREIVAEREGNEARIAIVDANGVRVGWRILSATPLAEIQLAEPMGDRVAVVLHVYDDAKDEFILLVLGARGIEKQLALTPATWAETAPLARFRLVGSSLYQLGSTPDGIFVDRFDLEVH